jgi:hypothetical protein
MLMIGFCLLGPAGIFDLIVSDDPAHGFFHIAGEILGCCLCFFGLTSSPF